MGFQFPWWETQQLSLTLKWALTAQEIPLTLGVVGLSTALFDKTGRKPLALFWGLATLALLGADNFTSLWALWLLSGVATLALFRLTPRPDERRGVGLLAQALALTDALGVLGLLMYLRFYDDTHLPSTQALREATRGLSDFPLKFIASTAALSLGVRVGIGLSAVWLDTRERDTHTRWLFLRLGPLVLSAGIFARKASFLWDRLPAVVGTPLALALALALGTALLVQMGRPLSTLFNLAAWQGALVDLPLRGIITFLDRTLDQRWVRGLWYLPSAFARAAGVWIALFQDGPANTYLLYALLGVGSCLLLYFGGGASL